MYVTALRFGVHSTRDRDAAHPRGVATAVEPTY